MTKRVLDDYYLAITLLVTIGYQLSGFFIAWTLQVYTSFGFGISTHDAETVLV
jgi:hypothetical protein